MTRTFDGMEETMPTKVGLTTILKPMTRSQAQRYGERHIPKDLKRAGFKVFVYEAKVWLNGWNGYRINYGK